MRSLFRTVKDHAHRSPHTANMILDERGSASVQNAVIIPLLFFVFFTIVQGALIFHAGNVAHAAAAAACNEARTYESTNSDGYAAGYETAGQSGSSLESTDITITRTATTVTATVSGQAPLLIPGLSLDISRSVSGPVEKWVD